MGFQSIKAWETGETKQSAGTMVFCSLHHHSTFSYLDGYGPPEAHVQRAAEMDMYALALTEHGNVTSHVQLERAGLKYGVKPIFGCEFYTGGIGEEEQTQKKNHLTVLAETQDGYRNLLRMVSRAWAEGFYYQPTVDGKLFREHCEGLIVLSGCQGSLLSTSLIGGKNIDPSDASLDRARKVASRFKLLLGDAYYIEVQAFPELEKTRNINSGLALLSEELGIPLVATLDAHYTRLDEGHMQAILHNVRGGGKKTLEEMEQTWGYSGDRQVPLCPLSDKDIYRRLRATGLTRMQAEAAIRNSRTIAERCNVRLPQVANLRYPLPPSVPDARTLFRKWINDGWKYRGFNTLEPTLRQSYIARVKYEMELIETKGFIDYFLVISDAVKYAKNRGIPVGPARGSAAASLVCYLMRITEVNPMLFPSLLFERFIDINRHDLPDIDLDFDDEKRYLVREYLVEKYGADRVGNIGTFTKYKGKNSLEDVQRAAYPEDWQCKADVETIKGLLLERKSGDLRADATIEDTVEMFPQAKEAFERWPELAKATLLEGNVRGFSTHAAGLVVANSPLSDFCAVYTRKNSKGEEQEVVSLDKHDAEYLNALKIDALGLKTMAMIRIALEQIGMSLDELYAIPLDDPATIQGFKDENVVGVFQFDGRAMQQVNSGVKPDNFFEISDINALARPGPLHSGATSEYIDIKHGRKTAVRYHSIIDEITEHTQGQIVYQEQILQVVRLLGGFSWEEAARIRKIISKKRGEQEFNTMRAKFIEGAAEHGLDERDADRVFSMLATAGAYAFNAAHCVSYGMLAYWTMWLKVHYPQAFYVAALRKYKDKENRKQGRFETKTNYILRDALKNGIRIGSVVLNGERDWWADEAGIIRPGYVEIPGVGDKTADSIIRYREEIGDFDDWDEMGQIKGIGPKTIESIVAFAEHDDPFGLEVLANKMRPVREAIAAGIRIEDHDGSVTGREGGSYTMPQLTHQSDQVPYTKGEDERVVWAGVIRDRNLKDLFEAHHSRTGQVLDPKSVKKPELFEWVVMQGEDESGILVITVDRFHYQEWKGEVWDIDLDKDVVVVSGVKKGFQARRAIYVKHLWIIQGD